MVTPKHAKTSAHLPHVHLGACLTPFRRYVEAHKRWHVAVFAVMAIIEVTAWWLHVSHEAHGTITFTLIAWEALVLAAE